MNPSPPTTVFERYLAVDLHKQYVMVGGVNAQQAVVLPPRRVELDAWPSWAKKNLRTTDALVIEATTNAWDFYDETRPYVGRMVVANAMKVKLIAQTRVKTDKRDTLALAHLLTAGLIPEVWVPPVEVRELRGLIAHRRQMVKRRTMVKNRLHSLLHRHHLLPPEGDPFARHNREWWGALKVSPGERLHLKHDLAALQLMNEQIAEAEAEVARLSTTSPWREQITYILQLPGFGLLGAMVVLGAIGDIRRFETAKQLVGYAGIGASIHLSGQTHRMGRIRPALGVGGSRLGRRPESAVLATEV